MKITVYGPGCAKCTQTEGVVRDAIDQAGVEAEVEHVTDIAEIAKAGILMTPGVAIDGKVVVKGKVPTVADMATHITSALDGARAQLN